MMSAKNLVLSYKKEEHKRITGSKDVKIYYWSDKDSSDDDILDNNDKLDSNISKYINKKTKNNE